jgi:hypothetical protein
VPRLAVGGQQPQRVERGGKSTLLLAGAAAADDGPADAVAASVEHLGCVQIRHASRGVGHGVGQQEPSRRLPGPDLRGEVSHLVDDRVQARRAHQRRHDPGDERGDRRLAFHQRRLLAGHRQ